MVVRFLLIPLAIVTLTEVIARYVFNSPTVWAWDVNLQIFGVIILLSGGYTLLHDRHVKIEAITMHLPLKPKLVTELIAMLLLMYVAVVLTWQGGQAGWEAFVSRERLNSIWGPPIFHIKMLLPVAGVLLLFQSLAKFVRDLSTLLRREG
ncbi:MAG: TRAP transporter small permease [Chloroflexi bacterium]|nr:TRAP transporter small permease [Chloroflexota bacterium]